MEEKREIPVTPPAGTRCPVCGGAVEPDDLFCGVCGGSLKAAGKTCPVCGTAAQPDARFCPVCGNGNWEAAPRPMTTAEKKADRKTRKARK
jgi:predicted nucleic acid-binding Zn ribbon protein